MTDNNEATAWNAVLGGGDTPPVAPTPKECQQAVKDAGVGDAVIAVGATLAGFVGGALSMRR